MSTKRKRVSRDNTVTFEYIFKKAGLLPKAVSRTFKNEAEGDRFRAYCDVWLEGGEIPDGLYEAEAGYVFVGDVIRGFLKSGYIPPSDESCLQVLHARIGVVPLKDVDYAWVETLVSTMKRIHHLAPTTIRHHIGALARCFDWGARQKVTSLVVNPLRMLPKRYATYSEQDRRALDAENELGQREGKKLVALPKDEERDRRLADHEEVEIRRLLAGGKPRRDDDTFKERELGENFRPALQCHFDLALETAMRMSEVYTLTVDQVNIEQRTIFLDKTKNGSPRQVPLTTVAIAALNRYYEAVVNKDPAMNGFEFEEGMLFPWFRFDAQGRRDVNQRERRRVTVRLSVFWANLFAAAGAPDLRFHDLRHEATARFFKRTKLRDIEIAKITGHKDLRMLARYANLRASELTEGLW